MNPFDLAGDVPMPPGDTPAAPPGADTGRSLEQIVSRYEQAWEDGPRPAIRDHLPANESLRQAALLELIHVELERRLKAGEPARAEEYLRQYPELQGNTDAVLALIAQEYSLRRRREPDLTADEFLQRFPAYRVQLADCLTTALHPGPQAPACIGKFTVVRQLGRGGQGDALLAVDPDLQRHVVLKLYRRARTEEEREAVLREGRALARVRSPYVAPCHGVEWHEGSPCLVVEYVPGSNLAEHCAARRPDLDAALEIVRQLAEGLAAVHACGLLHRDVKPANVVLGDDGVPRLVDFGLTAPVASAALQETAGTLAYMAPEQARGEGERVDARSDLFGLGGVLYEMLTGRPPYRAANRDELWELARAGEVTPPRQHRPDLPLAIEALCMRCLARSPGDRVASAADLVSAVQRVQRHRRLVARAHRWRWVAAAIAALAIIGLGLLLLPGHRPTNPDRSGTLPAPRHPDGRLLCREFPFHAELLGGTPETAGAITFRSDNPMSFRVEADTDCYVGIWVVEQGGAVTQLFPNQFDPDHLVRAGVPRLIPGDPPPGTSRERWYRIESMASHSKEFMHLIARTKRWQPPRGERAGAFDVFSRDDRTRLEEFWRDELDLGPDRGARVVGATITDSSDPKLSEVVIPFDVRP